MKILVSDLTGRQLDWAVSKCEGVHFTAFEFYYGAPDKHGHPEFHYSTEWVKGGPIIERERINIDPDPHENEWHAYYDNEGQWWSGSTPLRAAMRCYVASKLGSNIDLPEELS